MTDLCLDRKCRQKYELRLIANTLKIWYSFSNKIDTGSPVKKLNSIRKSSNYREKSS